MKMLNTSRPTKPQIIPSVRIIVHSISASAVDTTECLANGGVQDGNQNDNKSKARARRGNYSNGRGGDLQNRHRGGFDRCQNKKVGMYSKERVVPRIVEFFLAGSLAKDKM